MTWFFLFIYRLRFCADELSERREKRSAANALGGSAMSRAPGAAAFGVAGKIGEQRGDGVKSAMMMVPAEVVPAAGAPTPAVEPPPGA